MASARPSRSSLTPAEAEVVRAHVRQLVKDHGSQVAVAKLLGCAQPSISALLKEPPGWSPGLGFGRSVAKAVGTNLPALLNWPAGLEVDEADPYPNRARAVVAGRHIGLSEEAIVRLRKMTLKPGAADPEAVWWIQRAIAINEELRGPTA